MTRSNGDHPDRGPDGGQERVVINDKRRIDPETGEVRNTGGFFSSPFGRKSEPGDPAEASQPIAVQSEAVLAVEAAKQEAAERTADLQRITAEYANYRKRVDRDREAAGKVATARLLTEMLTVLDDVDLADVHGDLTGAFKAVADRLTGILTKAGLTQFGAVGDEFDPVKHEAVQFATSGEVFVQTVTTVMRHGYSLGDRLVRPAVVGVTGPDLDTPDPGGSADPVAGAAVFDAAFGDVAPQDVTQQDVTQQDGEIVDAELVDSETPVRGND